MSISRNKAGRFQKKKNDRVRELQAVRWENIKVDHHNYALVGPFTENVVDESHCHACHPTILDSGEVADIGHTCNETVGSQFRISNCMLIS